MNAQMQEEALYNLHVYVGGGGGGGGESRKQAFLYFMCALGGEGHLSCVSLPI